MHTNYSKNSVGGGGESGRENLLQEKSRGLVEVKWRRICLKMRERVRIEIEMVRSTYYVERLGRGGESRYGGVDGKK